MDNESFSIVAVLSAIDQGFTSGLDAAAAKALNDDLVGGVFVVMGILLFIWARSTSSQIYANRRLLVLTAGLLASEATAELCHGFVSGQPHMITAGFVELVVLRFVFIIISNSRKHNN